MLIFFSVELDSPTKRKFMEDCVEEYGLLMYTTAKRIVGEEEAADVVQDGVIRLIKHIDTIMELPRSGLTGYIVTTIRNTALDRLSAASNRQKHRGEGDPDEVESTAHSGRETEFLVLQKEDQGQFWEIWSQIPEAERELLEKKYIMEMPNKEIAKELGCKADSVRMKLTRARRKAMDVYKEWKNNDKA